MKSQKMAMIGIAVILVIALLAVPVAAKTASGDVKVENHEQNSVQDNSVKAEKTVHVELSGDASYKDEAHDPIDLTSNDGTIHVVVDADISAQGKTSGTGSAILDGTVKAEGSHDAGNTSAVINTSVTSSVDLNSGAKGSAQGCVNTDGTASATYNETVLESDVSGSAHADGKVTSGSVGLLNATGGILSEAEFLPDYVEANTLIYSYLYGENNAAGSASAGGSASASADSGNVTASVVGSTQASGSGKGSGQFAANSEIGAESEKEIPEYGFVDTWIYSNSSVSSGTGKYSATASSSASTPVGEENNAYYGGTIAEEQLYLDANTTGTASSKASICGSTGEAGSESGILAVAYPGPGGFGLIYGIDSVFTEFAFAPIDGAVDYSVLWSDAWATGFDKKSKVSAESLTCGSANAALVSNLTISNLQFLTTSNTSAEGETSSKVKVEGYGNALAESQIGSADLVGVGGGCITIGVNLIPTDAQIKDVPSLPDVDNPLLQQDLLQQESLVPEFPEESISLIDGFELPSISVLEISLISQSVSATNYDKGKAFANACADGETAADGQNLESYTPGGAEPVEFVSGAAGTSSASGLVAGGADAGAKCDHDPASGSVILGVSAQGIGLIPDNTDFDIQNNNAPAGLDATLIASFSEAGGSSGKTWGTASGDAGASGFFSPGTISSGGPSSSSGTVNTAASANGGLGLSTAAIGSADYTTFDGFEGSLVDVALIGTGSFAAGTAGANAYADGWTEANGSILDQIYIQDDEGIYVDLLNITSSASASGTACSDVSTKNGIALAADAILAGEGTSGNPIQSVAEIGITQDGDLGGGIAGSTISQVAFAQQFGKSGSAKANTYANGQAGTCSSFYVDLRAGSPAAPVYISGEGITDATGMVGGSANAGCGDPLSVSTIMAFTEFGGDGTISEGPEFIGTGEVYDAALIGSLSASWGKSADTWGVADGTASADSHLEVNTSSESPDSLYIWDSTSTADAKVKTTANTKGIDGFALSLAAQGSSSEVETELGDGGSGEEHAITLDGALSVASGDGKATADVNKMEVFNKDKKGKVIEVLCIPIVDREATAFAQFTGDTDNDQVADINMTSSSVSGSSASTSAEAAKGGFALSLAGEASGALTDLSAVDDVPIADQDVFSVIADLAIAETDCSKETAKAAASADGDTNALSYGELENWNGTQTSSAVGSISANAVGGDKCKDPLAASLILALGENEVYPDPARSDLPAQNTSDTTLIAALSVTNGSKGEAGASASGSADASGSQLYPDYLGTPMSPTSSASTDASVWSHAAGSNGFGLGVAGVGSSSFAHAGYDNHNVSDENLMFSYATGQGFGKKATVEACAGYDAAHTAASASNVYDRDLETAKAESNSSVAGVGNSYIKATDYSKAQALSFGWAEQNASIDFNANEAHTFAEVLFGTEANATDNAKGTLAKTQMCEVNLEAAARAGFVNGSINIPEEYASANVTDGSSHVFLDPYYLNGFVDYDTVYTADNSVSAGGSRTSGLTEAGDLGVDPNYWYTHAGSWANSDVSPAPSPWPPSDMILSHIPV